MTQSEYIMISTVEEWLTLISARPNEKFKLANDLDFEGNLLTNGEHELLTSKFTGILDGCGYAIKNARMPGGWAGHTLFDYNEGEIRNIAFINLEANKLSTNTGIVNINRGIIENLYVDFVFVTPTYNSSFNGVIAGMADNQLSKDKPSEIRNCIVNIRLKNGATLPTGQGSIVGKVAGWTGYVKNCYAIVNTTGIENIYVIEAASGVAEYALSTSKQFDSYSLLKGSADLSTYNVDIWTFTDTSITFFERVVYEVA